MLWVVSRPDLHLLEMRDWSSRHCVRWVLSASRSTNARTPAGDIYNADRKLRSIPGFVDSLEALISRAALGVVFYSGARGDLRGLVGNRKGNSPPGKGHTSLWKHYGAEPGVLSHRTTCLEVENGDCPAVYQLDLSRAQWNRASNVSWTLLAARISEKLWTWPMGNLQTRPLFGLGILNHRKNRPSRRPHLKGPRV